MTESLRRPAVQLHPQGRSDIAAFNRLDATSIDRGASMLMDLGSIRRRCGTAGEPIFVHTAYLDLLNQESS